MEKNELLLLAPLFTGGHHSGYLRMFNFNLADCVCTGCLSSHNLKDVCVSSGIILADLLLVRRM